MRRRVKSKDIGERRKSNYEADPDWGFSSIDSRITADNPHLLAMRSSLWANKKRSTSVNSAGSRGSADLTYGDFGVDSNADESTVYTVPEETRMSMRRLSNLTAGDMRSSLSWQNEASDRSSSHSSKFNTGHAGRRDSHSAYSRGSISNRDSMGSAKISRRTSSIDPIEEEGEYMDDEKPNESRDM